MKIVERPGSVIRSDEAACLDCGWQATRSETTVSAARLHAAGGHAVRLTRSRSVVLVDLPRGMPA